MGFLKNILGFGPPVLRRQLVSGETPEESVNRVAGTFRGKKAIVNWTQISAPPGRLSDVARNVARTFETRLREQGALVDTADGTHDYWVSFSWFDQPEFVYFARSSNRRSVLRAAKWQTEGRSLEAAMVDDCVVQGLYFFAMFLESADGD